MTSRAESSRPRANLARPCSQAAPRPTIGTPDSRPRTTGVWTDHLESDATTPAEHERRRAVHYKRIVEAGAIYSQPFSEGGAAAAGGVAFGTEATPVKGGWIVNGKKSVASPSGHAAHY